MLNLLGEVLLLLCDAHSVSKCLLFYVCFILATVLDNGMQQRTRQVLALLELTFSWGTQTSKPMCWGENKQGYKEERKLGGHL